MCYPQLVIFLDMCLVLLVYEPALFPTMLVPDTTGEKLRSWYAWSCKGWEWQHLCLDVMCVWKGRVSQFGLDKTGGCTCSYLVMAVWDSFLPPQCIPFLVEVLLCSRSCRYGGQGDVCRFIMSCAHVVGKFYECASTDPFCCRY
jgi:hypothetical protein